MRTDPAALRRWLRERIDAIEVGEAGTHETFSTGWRGLDEVLPSGGLRCGAIHEWFGLEPHAADPASPAIRGSWTPPLLILAHLAQRAASTRAGGWSIWIGARIWPTTHALTCAGIDGADDPARLARTLLIDPPTAADRLWAIDAALRCPGVVVIADGSSLDTAATRRLQLAAESGGGIGLLARPPHERACLSVAATRWSVRHAALSSVPADRPRWEVQLVRCKGAPSLLTDGRSVVLERNDAGSVVDVSPEVGERSGRAAIAS
ncbi:MAG: hypothetical protein IT438_16090 [Phycisphaerales bacterium]|nr:hypothetical protein [Phycisphaerales bacterium]